MEIKKLEEFLNDEILFDSLKCDGYLNKRATLFWGEEMTTVMTRTLCFKAKPSHLRRKATL